MHHLEGAVSPRVQGKGFGALSGFTGIPGDPLGSQKTLLPPNGHPWFSGSTHSTRPARSWGGAPCPLGPLPQSFPSQFLASTHASPSAWTHISPVLFTFMNRAVLSKVAPCVSLLQMLLFLQPQIAHILPYAVP